MLLHRGKLAAFVNSSTGVAREAAENILHILDTKQAQVDAAQEKVQTRIDHLNYIAAGVSPGTSSLARTVLVAPSRTHEQPAGRRGQREQRGEALAAPAGDIHGGPQQLSQG